MHVDRLIATTLLVHISVSKLLCPYGGLIFISKHLSFLRPRPVVE